MRVFRINLIIKKNDGRKDIEESIKPYLKIDNSTTFANIVAFIDDLKMIWEEVMEATRNSSYIELEINDSVYENSSSPLKQKSFNRWYFEGYNEDKDGIYLSHDEKYNASNADIYLTQDVLHDLAFTLC